MDVEDKIIGIICLTVLGLAVVYKEPGLADKAIIAIITAIAGMVTGRRFEKGG